MGYFLRVDNLLHVPLSCRRPLSLGIHDAKRVNARDSFVSSGPTNKALAG